MTREQTKTCLEAAIRACYHGATRRTRLSWVIRQAGVGIREAEAFISEAIRARLMEDHNGYGWITVTPFMIGIATQFDELAADVTAWQGSDR